MQSTVNPSLRRSTTVRHAPLTAMESPSTVPSSTFRAWMLRRPPLAPPLQPLDQPHLFDQSREHQNGSPV